MKTKSVLKKHYPFFCDVLLLFALTLVIFCGAAILQFYPYSFPHDDYYTQILFFFSGIGLFTGVLLLGIGTLQDWNIRYE